MYLPGVIDMGLFRVNQDGELVSSFGYFKRQPKIVNPELIRKLNQLFNDNDEQGLLYLDPPYYNTFDKYTSDSFHQTAFVEYLEDVTNKVNWKVVMSNSHDFEGIIAANGRINLPRIITVSVKDFSNTTKPVKDRV